MEIAATCKIIELDRFVAPQDWIAAPLIKECCHSFLASFKIWEVATVGGNIVMSLPAGPMISLCVALGAQYTLLPRHPREHRTIPAIDFTIGDHLNILAPGELLRSIFIPLSAFKKKYAFRRFTLTQLGRSEALLIGTLCPTSGHFILTITAATVRPIQLHFETLPSSLELKAELDKTILFTLYLNDPHGSPKHRQHLTYYFAEQIRDELSTSSFL